MLKPTSTIRFSRVFHAMIVCNEPAPSKSSIASDSDTRPNADGGETTGELNGSPPSYEASAVANTPDPNSDVAEPTETRVNHIYISDKNRDVKGAWTIDPNVRVPPQLLPVMAAGEEMANLQIENANGSISAELSLICDSDAPSRSSLETRSLNGHVWVNIVSCLDFAWFSLRRAD